MNSLNSSVVIKNCETGKAETTTDYKKFVFRMLELARAEQLHMLKDDSHETFLGHMDEIAEDIMKGKACLCGIGSIISDMAKGRINAVANIVNSANEEVEKLNAEIMTLKATPHPSMTDYSDIAHELKRENDELLEALKQKSVDCGKEIEELKKELREAKDRVVVAEGRWIDCSVFGMTKKEGEDKIEELKKENEELTDELELCVNKKNQLKEEYEELEKDNEKLEEQEEKNDEEIEELQEAYREKDEECDELKAKLKELTDLHPSPQECYDKVAHIKVIDENIALNKEKKELLAKILAIKNALNCSQTGYND